MLVFFIITEQLIVKSLLSHVRQIRCIQRYRIFQTCQYHRYYIDCSFQTGLL